MLAGAIDHWLYRNMVISRPSPDETGGAVDIGLLMPLLNQLALSPSPVVEQYVSSFLTNLTLRGILDPEQLFQSVFQQGNEKLRASLAGYFMECWPGISPELLSTFLAHCEADRDAEVVKKLGGVFAYHFEHAPAAVVEYLDRSLKPVDSFARALAFALEQSPLRVGRREEYSSQLAFLLTFGTLSALANFQSEDSHEPDAHIRAPQISLAAGYDAEPSEPDESAGRSFSGRTLPPLGEGGHHSVGSSHRSARE